LPSLLFLGLLKYEACQESNDKSRVGW